MKDNNVKQKKTDLINTIINVALNMHYKVYKPEDALLTILDGDNEILSINGGGEFFSKGHYHQLLKVDFSQEMYEFNDELKLIIITCQQVLKFNQFLHEIYD